MFDTMTSTKIAAGLCGALLVFLLGKWAADELYHVGGHGKDHGQAYVIDTGEEEAAEETVEVAFADVYASADAAKGAKVYRQCSACHKLEAGENATGPYLHNVVGRDIAAVDGFGYSGVLSDMEGDWTPENLNGFLEKPKDWAPGTAMAYNGLRDVEDRANLIAYLATITD